MSLDVSLRAMVMAEVFTANITHNLGRMADAAGIYKHLWRPEEVGADYARDIIVPLREGLERLKADPERFKKYDAPNGWGTYQGLVNFVETYLAACEKYPDSRLEISR